MKEENTKFAGIGADHEFLYIGDRILIATGGHVLSARITARATSDCVFVQYDIGGMEIAIPLYKICKA